MPEIIGNLRKLKSKVDASLHYYLCVGDAEISLREQLGQVLILTHSGGIYCIQCGRKTRQSFQQGFCYPCLQRWLECDLCIIHPEKCHVMRGTCPMDDWAHAQCHASHIVYLANSSGVKVGITRETQVPTRWIDQGAKQAIPIFKVANRYQAGMIEVVLKAFVSDRTHWRNLLLREANDINLMEVRDALLHTAQLQLNKVISTFLPTDIMAIQERAMMVLNYPVLHYPTVIHTLSFDKTPTIRGKLLGIKGQYLIFDTGVMNIRKFGGYEVTCQLT
ncbi:MAG: hypothetical protein A3F41_06965 [Coxiella sp. RIFCSPHIGHO2_12_FULL_44_14]|nr:MAG: hypothetical protein A3F41_06965 [Coxiella sp. RIFCSPHIGHO2_12_FULL_44_14]